MLYDSDNSGMSEADFINAENKREIRIARQIEQRENYPERVYFIFENTDKQKRLTTFWKNRGNFTPNFQI
jgi:hypothetical protein